MKKIVTMILSAILILGTLSLNTWADDSMTNVARGKQAWFMGVSNNWKKGKDDVSDRFTDGDNREVWCNVDPITGQYQQYMVDLEYTHIISRIQIYTHYSDTAFSSKKCYYSNGDSNGEQPAPNDSSWTLIDGIALTQNSNYYKHTTGGKNYTVRQFTFDFSPVEARYIKVISDVIDVNVSIYELEVYEINEKTDVTLSSISLSSGRLSPTFQSDVTEYKAQYPDVGDYPTVSGVAVSEENVSVDYTQASSATEGVATIVVTDNADPDNKKIYTITFEGKPQEFFNNLALDKKAWYWTSGDKWEETTLITDGDDNNWQNPGITEGQYAAYKVDLGEATTVSCVDVLTHFSPKNHFGTIRYSQDNENWTEIKPLMDEYSIYATDMYAPSNGNTYTVYRYFAVFLPIEARYIKVDGNTEGAKAGVREMAVYSQVDFGAEITTFEAESPVSAQFTYQNQSGVDMKILYVLAVYQNDTTLKDIVVESLNAGKSTQNTIQLTTEASLSGDLTNISVKAMIWNQGQLKPLSLVKTQ